MKRFLIVTLGVLILQTMLADAVSARDPCRSRGSSSSWHSGYYHSAWGMPVALVVPPTARFQTHWSWGVPSSRMSRIRAQFGRNYPGPGFYDRGMFRPTPPWPSDTDQFGVYYVRGPK
ncbi:MAG: hypothetical protein ACYTG0_13650 [Planctomycetota bacterium]|jgi:hypothetical protein